MQRNGKQRKVIGGGVLPEGKRTGNSDPQFLRQFTLGAAISMHPTLSIRGRRFKSVKHH